MTQSYWLTEKINVSSEDLTDKAHFDVIIVGAGIAGLSVAYWLEKLNPNLNVAIIEKTQIGIGASGRNAGFVTCGSAEHFYKLEKQFGLNKATEIWKFSEKNRELLKSEIIEDDSASVNFLSTGSCTVAPSEDDWQRYHSLAATMKSVDIDVELIDEKYLGSHYGVRNFSGAIQYIHDGVIHPIKLLSKIKSKLHKTKFIFGTEVHGLESAGLDWSLRLKDKNVTANKVIFCLNGYSNTALSELTDIVKPQRGQVILTEPLPHFVQGPCYLTKHLCYFRQLPTGELLIGGFRNHDIEAENTSEDQITPKIQNALKDFAHSYFQNTDNVKINFQWSGIMGFTPDDQMIIGEHPKKKNVHVMAGCSGHGMGLSFHAALTLVENLNGKPAPDHLKISRFSF